MITNKKPSRASNLGDILVFTSVEVEEILTDIETREVKEALESQSLKKLLGAANLCPGCETRGSFGSISRYTTMQNNEYILCSHCNKSFKIEKTME